MKVIERKPNGEKKRHLINELVECAGVNAIEIESGEEIVITSKAEAQRIEYKGPAIIIVNEL